MHSTYLTCKLLFLRLRRFLSTLLPTGRLSPIVLIVIFIPVPLHGLPKESSQILVIRFLVKSQIPAVVQVLTKSLLFRCSSDQLFYLCGNFLVFDPIVLFFLSPSLEALPRQTTFQKVQKNVTYGLYIVATRLLNA